MQKRTEDQCKHQMGFLCHVVLLQSRMGWWALMSTACKAQILTLTSFLAPDSWFHLSWNLFGADSLVPDWPQLYQWQVYVFFLGSLKRWSIKRPHGLLNSLCGFKIFRFKSVVFVMPVLLCQALSRMLLHVQIQNSAFVPGIIVICNL